VYLREDPVRDAVNEWLGGLFARENVDRTVAALIASQGGGGSGAREAVKARLTDVEAKLRRLQAAIEAGVDPVALVESINDAQAQRTALRAELASAPMPSLRSDGEIYAMIDSLGDVGAALNGGDMGKLASLYTALGLRIRYEHESGMADVIIEPVLRVNSACVRGGT
jgi:hypothetical protein